jgi:vacuolar protein sorting-associated protein 13A/C
MFEALVERLLNKILGEYIEEFSVENLKIGIWSGEVVLKNIALKKSVIRKFNLPFRINYSKLGILRMNIPWKSLTSSKIEVLLEGLELVVSEVPISEWDCKDSRIIEKRKQEIQSYCEAVLADFASRADKSK